MFFLLFFISLSISGFPAACSDDPASGRAGDRVCDFEQSLTRRISRVERDAEELGGRIRDDARAVGLISSPAPHRRVSGSSPSASDVRGPAAAIGKREATSGGVDWLSQSEETRQAYIRTQQAEADRIRGRSEHEERMLIERIRERENRQSPFHRLIELVNPRRLFQSNPYLVCGTFALLSVGVVSSIYIFKS